jgi:hypothetical protein
MQELIEKSLELEAYSPFKSQLAEIKSKNEHLIFGYGTKEEIKEVRSYVNGLRKTKAPITAAHKQAKADSIAYGKKLDAGKNYLLEEIDAMIDVHMGPIKIKEERDKACEATIAEIRQTLMDARVSNHPREIISEKISYIDNLDLTEFGEYEDTAAGAKLKTVDGLTDLLRGAIEREAEEEEKAEKERLEMVATIQKEATEKAEAEAEYKIEQAELEAERKIEFEKARAKDDAAREIEAFKAKADKARTDQAKADKAIADQAVRNANVVEHKQKINAEILNFIVGLGVSEEVGKSIIVAAVKGEAGNLFVKY